MDRLSRKDALTGVTNLRSPFAGIGRFIIPPMNCGRASITPMMGTKTDVFDVELMVDIKKHLLGHLFLGCLGR